MGDDDFEERLKKLSERLEALDQDAKIRVLAELLAAAEVVGVKLHGEGETV